MDGAQRLFALSAKDGRDPARRWVISGQPVVVGRGRECDLIVFDPLVSRRHCQLWVEGGRLRYQDMGSSNATEVNGVARTDGELYPGDEVRVGDHIFVVSAVCDDPEPGPPDGDETPRTVAAEDTPYYSKARTPGIGPDRVQGFGSLLATTRRFSQASTVSELCAALESILRDQLGAAGFWIALYSDSGSHIVLSQEFDGPQALPEQEFRQVRELRRGVLAPVASGPSDADSRKWVMAAPMEVGGKVFGAVSTVLDRARDVDESFTFFVALVHALAPFYRTLERAGQISRDLDQALGESDVAGALVGTSADITQLREHLKQVAASDLNVLLLGETGTGKELVSRLIHDMSGRADRPFVVVNCPSIPGDLFESVMFGHHRGSFTGALTDRDGYFLEAQGGTLFLDEIGDLPSEFQTRLLRAVETGGIRKVGGNRDVQTNVRIIAATNRTGDDNAANTAFPVRADLYHRLAGFEITLPPLRNRKEDVPSLAMHFLGELRAAGRTRAVKFEASALDRLRRWHWPGNVRELRLCIERASVLARTATIGESDVILWHSTPGNGDAPPVESSLDMIEKWHVERVLKHCGGNVTSAAQLLGISRSTAYEMLRRHQLAPDKST